MRGAHDYWDQVWESGQWDEQWSNADPWVTGRVASLRAEGSVRVLDLGCGVGRHAVALAALGARVVGLDASTAALEEVGRRARNAGVRVELCEGNFAPLPFEDDSFDYVLSYNAVYHGDEASLRSTLSELRRVLRPGGIYQCTMLSKANHEYGRGLEVSRNTFVQPDAEDDKIHEHLYLNREEIEAAHVGLSTVEVVDREHGMPGSFHYHCVFVRDGVKHAK